METAEAEAVKLFSNTYLALRVAFFNELDTFAQLHDACPGNIINGVCMDPRIGGHYNNPSFGYGGYCLPKDSKQLLTNYLNVPNKIIGAVVEANRTRKDFIAQQILARKPKIVGIYRLSMKSGSDNFRSSATLSVVKRLIGVGAKVVVYEPLLEDESIHGATVLNDISEFKKMCDLIVANRYDPHLDDIKAKVFTRDLYGKD